MFYVGLCDTCCYEMCLAIIVLRLGGVLGTSDHESVDLNNGCEATNPASWRGTCLYGVQTSQHFQTCGEHRSVFSRRLFPLRKKARLLQW